MRVQRGLRQRDRTPAVGDLSRVVAVGSLAHRVSHLALLWLLLGTAACSPGYVLRAGYEEAKILWRRQAIAELLAQDTLDASMRAKLELVLRVREFARDDLGLNVGGSYASYASVDAAQIVHVVTAAERLRLEPYTWWFPVVGRVPYKGYFSEAEARAEAARLDTQGFDTYVRTSAAFSTLGWFDDPLLSTMLRRDRVDLVDTVIHELLHSTSYIGGQASFDESFANFVGHRGAIAFFHKEGDTDAVEQAQSRWADALRFSSFLTGFVDELVVAYAAGITPEERERLFTAAQGRFAALTFMTRSYAGFATMQLNNAIILHELLYFDRLALFEKALDNAEGDLAATIRGVIDASALATEDPFGALRRTLDAHEPRDDRVSLSQTSSEASRRMPSRTEMTNTPAASVNAAPKDATMPNWTAADIGVS